MKAPRRRGRNKERSQTWAPSSVREVRHRDLYRGHITWNKTKKWNVWGAHQQTARPAGDWIDIPAPQLAIVADGEWQAAHARLDVARTIYLKGTHGRAFGRP